MVTDRQLGLERGLSIVGAENATRRGTPDLQTSCENANRSIEANNEAMQAQHTRSIVSSGLAGAGLGYSLATAGALGATVAGGMGAALGGGAGLLLGFL